MKRRLVGLRKQPVVLEWRPVGLKRLYAASEAPLARPVPPQPRLLLLFRLLLLLRMGHSATQAAADGLQHSLAGSLLVWKLLLLLLLLPLLLLLLLLLPLLLLLFLLLLLQLLQLLLRGLFPLLLLLRLLLLPLRGLFPLLLLRHLFPLLLLRGLFPLLLLPQPATQAVAD